ncbi:uncharacterized protein B0I36DRAFT_394271 [Microdochium trichocladiopsis]|uniref:Uncharacterized protein n=1 Tax=Microdochium trichocladiopsis TaxID=1682393 RepID=A0A9P9BLC9_9PEZI|nr:uncharacterized protein B0I36DRAFT_394271 [Microdochium trichocladiopsis]KAH7021582.1 hypothetical protein B0I36DRAFT_394271 [Microdochium trichocladiopsis]
MPDIQAKLERLKAGWNSCKAQDDQKHSLISDLFACIDDLSGKLSEAESELRDKKRSGEKEIQALQLEMFKDELVKQGLDGGKKTACLLKQAVIEELRSSAPAAAHHLKVVVRVYANVKGLAKTYKVVEVLSEATFDDFVRGFNMGDPLCDYIDAGNGKECADAKVRAYFELCLADIHCQQIIFGGTADDGYARLLGPHAEDDAVRGRVTLLEGPPFAYELAGIKDKYRPISLENVFRSQKLVKEDPPLNYSHQDFLSLQSRKLCNSFQLLGKCPFLDTYGNCQHGHIEGLSPKQIAALRAVARQSPCKSGLSCSDPGCIYGHRCTRDNCALSTCRFSPGMHYVETTIVGKSG